MWDLKRDIDRGKVENLIKRIIDGWDVNEPFPDDMNPSALHVLISSCEKINENIIASHELMAKILIDAGANINLPDKSGRYPIQKAIMKDKVKIVDVILKAGASLIYDSQYGCNLLHEALLANSIETIKLFLTNRYVLRMLFRNYAGPTENFSLNTYDEVVEFIINYINLQELNIPKTSFPTLLQFLIQNCDARRFGQLAKYYDATNILCALNHNYKTLTKIAVEESSREVLQHLFELEASIVNRWFDTESLFSKVLILAVQHKNVDIVQFVLEKGGDINKECNKLDLWFPVLIFRNQYDAEIITIIKLLLQHGIDVNKPIIYQHTPLLLVIDNYLDESSTVSTEHILEVMKLLLCYGADVNAKSTGGYFALDMLLTMVDYNGERFSQSSVTYLLVSFIAKLSEADKFVSAMNLVFVQQNTLLNSYYLECLLEIAIMRDIPICESSNLRYYDFFINSNNCYMLGSMIRNRDVMRTLKSEMYKDTFPIYSYIIKWTVEVAEKRLALVHEGIKLFSEVRQWNLEEINEGLPFRQESSCLLKKKLTPDVLDVVFSYLSNKDLSNFLKALKD